MRDDEVQKILQGKTVSLLTSLTGLNHEAAANEKAILVGGVAWDKPEFKSDRESLMGGTATDGEQRGFLRQEPGFVSEGRSTQVGRNGTGNVMPKLHAWIFRKPRGKRKQTQGGITREIYNAQNARSRLAGVDISLRLVRSKLRGRLREQERRFLRLQFAFSNKQLAEGLLRR